MNQERYTIVYVLQITLKYEGVVGKDWDHFVRKFQMKILF